MESSCHSRMSCNSRFPPVPAKQTTFCDHLAKLSFEAAKIEGLRSHFQKQATSLHGTCDAIPERPVITLLLLDKDGKDV